VVTVGGALGPAVRRICEGSRDRWIAFGHLTQVHLPYCKFNDRIVLKSGVGRFTGDVGAHELLR